MKKITLIFVIMLLSFTVAHAQWAVDEGFEGTFPPTGWALESTSGDNWVQDDGTDHGPGSAYSGTYAAMYNNYDYSSGNSGSMTTPAFDISTLAFPQLDFYWWNDDSSYNPAKLVLYTSDDGTTFVPFDTLDVCQSGGWVNYNVALATTVTHVKFEGISDWGVKNTFVDNFKIGQPDPYDVAVNQLTPDAGVLAGTSNNYFVEVSNLGISNDTYDLTVTGGAWTYEIRDKDDTATISTLVINAGEKDTCIVQVTVPAGAGFGDTDTETFTATSQGDPGVSDDCDITTTAIAPIVPPLAEDFEGVTPPGFSLGWAVTNDGSGNEWESYDYSYYAHSGDKMAGVKYHSSNAADTWLFTQPVSLTTGTPYVLDFWYRGRSSSYDEKMNVYICTGQTSADTLAGGQLWDNDTIDNTTYAEANANFTVPSDDVYYIGFHCYSDPDQYYLYLDDVSLVEIPPAPVMVLSDSLHDFGMVEQGTPASWDVTISNTGGGTLYIYGATINPPFSCVHPDSIIPGGNDIATITLDTSNPGVFNDLLTFQTNATEIDSTVDLIAIVYGTDYVTEGFEDVEFPPFGWSNPGRWRRYTNDPYAGDAYARISWYHDDDASLITPRLIIESGDFINFWWRNANMYDGKGGGKVIGGDTLFVEISNTYNNATPIWEELTALSPEEPMLVYENVLLLIPDTYIGDDAKIRFRHRSELNAESRGVGLDEVMLPPLNTPINFALDPYSQSDYDAIGTTVDYEIDVHNIGVQADRYYISLAGSKTRRDVLIDEGFEGATFPPAGWSEIIYGTYGWEQDYYGSGSYEPPEGTGAYFANCDSDAHSGENVYAGLFTPSLDLSGGSATIEFVYNMQDMAGDGYAELNVYSGGTGAGNFEEQLWTEANDNSGFLSFGFDPSGYANPSDVYIEFMYDDENAWAWNFAIDDVIIEGTGGGGPTPPTGWPVTFSDPYLDINPGEMGTFTASVEIPDDGSVIEDDVNTSTIYVESREDPLVNHEADVVTTAHPKDPYEPNNDIVDATPWAYGEITEDAQIYYNPDYADKDIDIYEFSGLVGDIILCDFILPPDETEFDGAIKLVDADSTEIAFADSWAGGGSEQLQYRLLVDGTYYLVLGKWDNILDGPFKKDTGRGVNTCYYAMSLELIPSPDIAVSPDSLQLGVVASKETASVDMFIENTGVTGCEDLTYNIEVVIPGVETLYESDFSDFADWTITGGTNWGVNNSSYAGGTPPEARFNWNPNTTALQRIISPVINTTGYTSANLTFKHYVNYYALGVTIGVATTSDGGTTWNTVWSTSPTGNIGPETVPVTVDNADMGSDQFQLCWFFDGISFDIDYWYVDDIYLGVGSAWCSVEPPTGSIEQGAIQTCVVTCDASAKLDPGIYTADIIVHNDALLYGASDVTIPLTFFYQVAALGLQGTVTFELTGEPIDSVKVSAGNFVTYTNEVGFYEFTDIAAGTYDVLFEKDGFATHTAYGISLNPGWVVLLDVAMLFDGPPPRNLNATGGNQEIIITWDKPEMGGGPGGQVLYELIQHDGNPLNAYYQAFDNGYGVVYDVSGYTNVTLDQLDFRHSSWGVFGIWDYKLHIVDWDTHTEVAVIEGLQTTGDDRWEEGIDLGSVSETGLVGVFLEPLGNIATDAYPCIDSDNVGPNGLSYYGPLPNYAGMSLSSIGDFLMDLWILADETEVPVKAQVFPAQISYNQPTRLPVYDQNIEWVSTDQKVNTNTLSRDFTLLGYNLYREDVGVIANINDPDSLIFIDDIVAVGTEYTYYARGVFDEGEGAESNHDSAIPFILKIEDFEADDGGFVGTGQWEWGAPTSGPGNAHSGDKLWATNLGGDYNASSNYTLDSPDILVLQSEFWFWHWYDIEASYDGGNVKISTDGGATWTVIIPDGGYPGTANSSNPLYPEPIFCGHGQGYWELVTFDVSAYLGLTVNYRWHFGSDSSVQYPGWYIDDVLIGPDLPPDYGALEGIVTDGDLDPLEGVAVDAILTDYNTVYTDADGFYSIDPMRVGLYDVTFSKVGYSTIIVEDVEILVGETTVLDTILGNPTMDIDPTSIPDATVPVGGTSTCTITVANNGNAQLDWSASIENQTDADYSINYDLKTNPPTHENSEMAPFSSGIYEGSIPEDTWDILYNFNCQDGGQPGIETNSQHIFTSDWRSTATYTFWKHDMDGTFVESFNIPGVTRIRDMAYDDQYFYGSPASTTIYIMDLENQAQIGTISVSCAGVTGVRHIAYDPELDGGNGGFWIGNWGELGAITMTGSQIYGNIAGAAESVYGSAYDPFTDGGPYLWLFAQPSSNAILQQFDIATQSLTGVTHNCSDMPGFDAGIAGGAATYITPEGIFAMLVNIQQSPNLIGAYELCEATPPWIILDPDAGTVPPGDASQEITAYFYANDDPVGTIHTCDILFESAQGVPPVTVPVTLTVGTPEYGDLTGTVTAATGGAPIVGAMIKASNDADYTYETYSVEGGLYEILNMMVGYYDVECTAVGYNDQLVPDVEIVVDQTTTQNFEMTAPIMVVNPMIIDTYVLPGLIDTTYITIQNTGDGPMDFDITLYDYGKVLTDYSNCSTGGTISSKNGTHTGPGNSNGFQVDAAKDEVTLHYDGINNDAIGLTAGGTFMVAARFTADELGLYYDTYEIKRVELYINDRGSALTLKIWEGGSLGDPGSEIYSEDVWSQIVAESWNDIDLISGVALISGNEYWVGYEVTHASGEYPAGCDAGPAVDGKGDWIYFNSAWDEIQNLGLDYNWNIRMVIDFCTAPWITVVPLFGTIPAGDQMDIAVIFNTTELTLGDVKTADIEIVSTPDVGVVTVPVTMTVGSQSAGDTPVIETKLNGNFPNPMLNSTTFRFSLKDRSHVKLTIYNIKGQLVGTLLDNELDPSADHKVVWDGTANGKKLANGIYFYKLETNSKTFLKKMVLMK